jgi:heptosyltransferase-1
VRILIVKTTSMGDVVHALPALSDLKRALPDAQVDWLVEAPFAAIPAWHPGVDRVLPLAWRKWRKHLGQRATWQAMGALRGQLRAQRYDAILDLQGLLKSVAWGAQAQGPISGYDWHSIREPLASVFYHRRYNVPRTWHAVQRSRRLAALALGYPMPESAPDFGLQALPGSPRWAAPAAAAALIPCASRPEKLWPEADWIVLGHNLQARGLTPVLLWGNAEEEARAQRVADACGGVVPPFLSVHETGQVLAGCALTVGLDTGFSHLAAAFGVPTLGIYCDHEPGLAGITGAGWVRSLGGKGQRPSLADVQVLVAQMPERRPAGG